jgi:hypothetical protein
MSVDLIFRYGPTQLFAASGSSDVGTKNLRFQDRTAINSASGSTTVGSKLLTFIERSTMRSQFIGGTRGMSFPEGRMVLQPIQQATNLTPSGKGWDYPLEGQGFSSGSSHQLFPKLKR